MKNIILRLLSKISFFENLLELNKEFSEIKIIREKTGAKIHINNCFYYDDLNNFTFGKQVSFGPNNVVFVTSQDTVNKPSKLVIGFNTSIGEQNNIRTGGGSIYIGENCLISQQVSIIASDHGIIKDKLIKEQPWWSRGDVIIGNDVWVGCSVQILSGVKVGNGVVIASGSLVNKDIPDYAIVGGVPARILKYRE